MKCLHSFKVTTRIVCVHFLLVHVCYTPQPLAVPLEPSVEITIRNFIVM
jgi:hypothetical protein